METSTPQPTLRAPGGAEALSAYEAAKAKEADKKLVLELLQAPELFSLADASSAEAANRGTPVSLLHAILRVYLGAFGLNWERFLVGGILGKTIADAIKLRLASGELPITKGKLLSLHWNQSRLPLVATSILVTSFCERLLFLIPGSLCATVQLLTGRSL